MVSSGAGLPHGVCNLVLFEKESVMNQRKLMRLLEEAARPDCTEARRTAIRCQIQSTQATPGSNLYVAKREGIEDLLGRLFVEIVAHRPESLPDFYPVFALAYGNRAPKTLLAKAIDWWPLIRK